MMIGRQGEITQLYHGYEGYFRPLGALQRQNTIVFSGYGHMEFRFSYPRKAQRMPQAGEYRSDYAIQTYRVTGEQTGLCA